jgi:sigma-E factor negative regulatory protein RseA
MVSKQEQNDRLAESLSSLFDDHCEAAEIDEILEQDAKEWQEKMHAYALTSSILSSDNQVDHLATDLVARVREGIEKLEDEDAKQGENVVSFDQFQAPQTAPVTDDKAPKESKVHFIKQAVSGLAMAASVAFVVIGGGSYLLEGETNPQSPALAQAPSLALPIDVKPLQQVSAEIELDNKRLQSYLRQHAEQSTMAAGQGMLPMARVVSYPVEQK